MSKQDDYERKMRRLAVETEKNANKAAKEREEMERLLKQQRKNR